MARGLRALLTDDVRAAATRLGVSTRSAIFIEAASRGVLRETMPYALEWLQTQRDKARAGALTPEKVAALDDAMPGWRRLRPVEIDRDWARRHSAPIPPRQRKRKKKSKTPADSGAGASTPLAPRPGPGVIRVSPAPAPSQLRLPETSQWLRVIKAARGGNLTMFQGALRALRNHASDGSLPLAETRAMDTAAPGWRSTPAEALDAAWRQQNASEGAPEAEASAPALPAPEASMPMAAKVRSNLSKSDRVMIDRLRSGDDGLEARGWLDSLIAARDGGELSDRLQRRLGIMLPSWESSAPTQSPGATSPRTDSEPHLTPKAAPAPSVVVEDHSRTIAAFALLAGTGMLEEMPEAARWLQAFRDAASAGKVSAPDRSAMDAAFPKWANGSFDSQAAALTAPLADHEAPANASKRGAFIEDFDERSLEMLDLVERGALASAGMKATNWLIRERGRAGDGRLAPHIVARYSRVMPGWRGDSPTKLDRAWQERESFDA